MLILLRAPELEHALRHSASLAPPRWPVDHRIVTGSTNRGRWVTTVVGVLRPVFALAVALLVPLVTRGSYARLFEKPWRWGSFLFAGLLIQVGLDVLPIPKSHWHDLGFGLLVVSYVLLLGFCGRNVLMQGMSIVF